MTTTTTTMSFTVQTDPDERVVVAPRELPELSSESVRVRVHYSYISAGTELIRLGLLPHAPQDHPTERGPLGYSLAGEIVEIGDAVQGLNLGQPVACVGAGAFHAEEVVVAQNLVVPIPDGVSMRAAAPAAMMCFPLEGTRKMAIEFGENVLVVGAGAMGQIASQYALASGARVWLTDLNAHRLSYARVGIKTFIGDDAGWAGLAKSSAPVGIEKAQICIGGNADAILAELYKVLGRSPDGLLQGRLVFTGMVDANIPFASSSGNLEFLSSAKAGPGYRDAHWEAHGGYPAGYVKWTVRRNVEVCLNAIAAGQLEIEPLITHEYAIEQAMQAYTELSTPGTEALIALLRCSE